MATAGTYKYSVSQGILTIVNGKEGSFSFDANTVGLGSDCIDILCMGVQKASFVVVKGILTDCHSKKIVSVALYPEHFGFESAKDLETAIRLALQAASNGVQTITGYGIDNSNPSNPVIVKQTGWAAYQGGQYTQAAPLFIPEGNTAVLEIDPEVGSGIKIESQLPDGVTTFWDNQQKKILPVAAGDGYAFSVGFKATSSSNNGDVTLCIDIGGTIGNIFCRTFRLPRGIGIVHDFYFTTQGYALDTFVANGGIPKITSGTGDTSIYDMVLQVHRTYAAS